MAEVETFERPDRRKLLEPDRADLGVLQAEILQLRQPRQHDELFVGNRRAVERHGGDLSVRHLHFSADGAQPLGDRRVTLVATTEAAIARFGSGLDDSRMRNSAFGSFDVSSRTPELVTRL